MILHAILSVALFHADAAHTGVYPQSTTQNFGGLQWRVPTGGAVRSSPAIANGVVYVGNSDNGLYAIDERTGAQRWRFNSGSPILSSPAVDDRRVYFQNNDNTIFALDRAKGTVRWKVRTGRDVALPWGYESGDFFYSSPTLVDGTLYIGSGDSYVYALDAATGRQLWRSKTGGRIRATPAIRNGVLYVGSYDGVMYAFDARTGAQRWRYRTEGADLRSGEYGYDRRSLQSSPAVDGEGVFFGARDGYLYALDLEGKLRWRIHDEVYWYIGTPALHGGKVFADNSDGRFIQAVDERTGKILWSYATEVNLFASPTVSNGTVYAGDWSGWMYALDERTGALEWKYKSGGRRIFSSVAVDTNRIIYGCDDGGLYAINTTAQPLQRAVYFDPKLAAHSSYRSSDKLAKYLTDRGYQALDSATIEQFLSDRARDGQRSVVVFATDDLSLGTAQADKLAGPMMAYLRHGGKVVWVATPPLLAPYSEAVHGRDLTTLSRTRPHSLLGVGFERGTFDTMTVYVTPAGLKWGIAGAWLSNWSADPQTVSEVLARDEQGLANAWVRSYGGPPGTGFAMMPLVETQEGYPLTLAGVQNIAEYFPL